MRRSAAFLLLLLTACAAEGPPAISIDDAWVRATAPGQAATAAYFTIVNAGGGDRVVAVSSTVGQASLHSTSMDDGVMRMRPLDALDIPAGSMVELKPAGTHVMIGRLRRPLAKGERIPLQLTFERSGTRVAEAQVR